MKTKENLITEDKTLTEQLRDIRDKISIDIQDFTIAQMKVYFSKQKTLHPTSIWK